MNYEIINIKKKQLGLTNAQIAERTGITLSTLDKITSGANTNPKLDTLKAIAAVIGCKLDDFNDEAAKPSTLSLEAQRIGHKFDSFSEDKKRLLRGFIVLLEEADKAASMEAMLDAADEAEDQEA